MNEHPPTPIVAVKGENAEVREDRLAVEEPLEIRIEHPDPSVEGAGLTSRTVSITMRTPGADIDLALGFLWTEGVLRSQDDVLYDRIVADASHVTIALRGMPKVAWSQVERSTFATGACGMCGKTSLDAVRTGPYAELLPNRPFVESKTVMCLPDLVRQLQAEFSKTGGEHASALATAEGEVLAVREDVGRHNALDKIIGNAFQRRELPLHDRLIILSGRASFELVQKSAMAGIGFVMAVGAPSTSAVQLALEVGITLIGFARDGRFNIYAGRERVGLPKGV